MTGIQLKYMQFIEKYILDNGLSPTLKEISEKIGVCQVTVFGHIKTLKSRGYLRTRFEGESATRNIEIVEEKYAPIRSGIVKPKRIAVNRGLLWHVYEKVGSGSLEFRGAVNTIEEARKYIGHQEMELKTLGGSILPDILISDNV
jgi:SOS-response transcriptional repressor LexA